MASEDRFGYEWSTYSAVIPQYEAQFLNWVSPMTKEDFAGKAVLDGGCGMGRNSYWPLTYGAARVVAFDFDEGSVKPATANLKQFPNATVLFRSIYDIDWENEFDIAMSIGVIHHLKDPKLALKNLVRALKPGGTLVVWVYSYEGNEWIVRYVDPIRKSILSKLPVGLVHAVSYLCSVPLWLYVKVTGGHTPYLRQLSTYQLRDVHSIVFDQLIPEVANYWKKDQVPELVNGLPVRDVHVEAPPNKQGWILRAVKV